MLKDFGQNDPKITKYVVDVFKPEDKTLAEIRTRAVNQGLPEIQVGPMDRLHLEVLAAATNAKKVVEIGTLAGYSGISLLRGMPFDGRLFTFEFDPHHAEVARESFKRAGVLSQVEILIGPALEQLPRIEEFGPFDLVFIDADKVNYPKYLEWAAENLRVGGVVLGDNTFAFGYIAADSFDNDPELEQSVHALREFNKLCVESGRFKATMLPTAEGLTMAVKIK